MTAGLSGLLRRQRPLLALEFDPQNLLATYLGCAIQPELGIVACAQQSRAGTDLVLTAPDQVRLLPFGAATTPQRSAFETVLAADAHWLERFLQGCGLPQTALVVIDTARMPSIYAEQAVAAANLILAVSCCDVSSAIGVASQLRLRTAQKLTWVINQIDPTRQLQQDIRAVLQSQLQAWPLFVVHRDEAIPSALASNRAVADFAPHSQAAVDLQTLATWLLESAPPAPPGP